MVNQRRRFWMPASNYYVLSFAICGVVFFVVLGVLNDLGDQTPWVTAGIAASVCLIGAVLLREVILRKARRRQLHEQHLREERVRLSQRLSGDQLRPAKLSIEDNALLLSEIRQKSEAARLLGKFSASHREVWEICSAYLSMNENELRNISPNSPRLAPLLKGRSTVSEQHRFHLLRWAEIEARSLTAESNTRTKLSERIEAAQGALGIVDTALGHYPQESSLLESREVLVELISSIKVSKLVERAERAARRGEVVRAHELYDAALFQLERDGISSDGQAALHGRIRSAIEELPPGQDGPDDGTARGV